VRELDLALLCQTDEARATAHFEDIVSARAGDLGAASRANAAAEQVFHERFAKPQPPVCTESEHLIPSTSELQYPVEAVSHKGAVLLRLAQQGYPVPDFIILGAKNYLLSETERRANVREAITGLTHMSEVLHCASPDPLVFAIRCAMPVYMPGVMYTFLNVGVTHPNLPNLAARYGNLAAERMLANNLRNFLLMQEDHRYASLLDRSRSNNTKSGTSALLEELLFAVGSIDPAFLEDPWHQADFFVAGAYAHYRQNLDLLHTFMGSVQHYPSLIFQTMVCTVRDERSHAGVLYSRHPRNGQGMHLQVARNVLGEDIMTGTVEAEETSFERQEDLAAAFPGVSYFCPNLPRLEEHFRSPVTLEFAVETTGRYDCFALLQLNCSELSGRAAFLAIMNLYRRGIITRQRVLELIRPYHFTQMESDTISPSSLTSLQVFSQGVSVLPRTAVTGRAYFSAETVLAAKRRGEKVCYFKQSFQPSDTVIMREMDAIVCGTPAAIHVVTLCQGFGIPALLNMERYGNYFAAVDDRGGRCLVNTKGVRILEGDWVTVSSRRQTLYLGRAEYQPGRLLRYMNGEKVHLDPGEENLFPAVAEAYREYQELVSHLELRQINGIRDLVRLVRFDLDDEHERSRTVNEWFDQYPQRYLEEVFACEMGAHLNQHTIYLLLTLDRQVSFFHSALAKSRQEGRSGLGAGCFVLGRFLASPHPVRFWKSFSSSEIATLLNEWLHFEQYMDVLTEVGERNLNQAKKRLGDDLPATFTLHPGRVKHLLTLKLAGIDLHEVMTAAETHDHRVVELCTLLLSPYKTFFQFNSAWSLGQLRRLCEQENLPIPGPDDV